MVGDEVLCGEAQDEDENGIVLRRGEGKPLSTPAELLLEDGAVLGIIDELPPGLPLGRHELRFLDRERSTTLIVVE